MFSNSCIHLSSDALIAHIYTPTNNVTFDRNSLHWRQHKGLRGKKCFFYVFNYIDFFVSHFNIIAIYTSGI